MLFWNIWYFPGNVPGPGNNTKRITNKDFKNLIMLCDAKKKKKEKVSVIIKPQKTNNRRPFFLISLFSFFFFLREDEIMLMSF